MKKMKSAVLLTLTLILLCGQIFAQGKIISKTEADNLFGKVIYSQKVSAADLQNFVFKSGRVLMFGFSNSQLVVATDNRTVLNSVSFQLQASEILHIYSKDVVQELINDDASPDVYIEVRANVLTITHGSYTLEYGSICPPCCPDC